MPKDSMDDTCCERTRWLQMGLDEGQKLQRAVRKRVHRRRTILNTLSPPSFRVSAAPITLAAEIIAASWPSTAAVQDRREYSSSRIDWRCQNPRVWRHDSRDSNSARKGIREGTKRANIHASKFVPEKFQLFHYWLNLSPPMLRDSILAPISLDQIVFTFKLFFIDLCMKYIHSVEYRRYSASR